MTLLQRLRATNAVAELRENRLGRYLREERDLQLAREERLGAMLTPNYHEAWRAEPVGPGVFRCPPDSENDWPLR